MGVLAPGTLFGGCRIEGVVGRGGMGVVYRAHQLDLDRDVALKVIAPELIEHPQSRNRFLTEARAAGAVEHPNVVPIHGVGIADGQAYLVMRYVAGDNLRTVVHRRGALTPMHAAEIAARLGDALDAIHRAGYVHRDVKPQNVMIDDSDHVYLSDFGLAKEALATTGLTKSDQWVGTLDYVAPEQIRGHRVDARADVYALGGVLHFMLTGHVPFEREGQEAKMWAHLHDEPPRPTALRPELPAAFDAVVQRALAKDPAHRQPSAGDLGRAATAAAAGRSVEADETGTAAIAPAPAPRNLATEATTASAPRVPSPAASGGRQGRLPYVGAAVAVIAAAGVALLLAPDRRAAPPEGQGPTSTPASSQPRAPDDPSVGPTIRHVGIRPRDAAVLAGDLWVISYRRPRVTRLDTTTGRRHGDRPLVGRGASSIAGRGNTLWVAVPRRGEVVRVDARSGHVEARIKPPLPPVRVVADRDGFWAVGRGAPPDTPDLLLHYDRATGQFDEPIAFSSGITAITLGGGAIWLALTLKDRVVRLVPSTGEQRGVVLTGPATSLAYGLGHVWASQSDDNAVARVDPRLLQAVTTTVAQNPAQLAVAGGRVFVASNTDHRVVVLHPDDIRRKRTRLEVPLNPYGVVAGAGHVWVTGLGSNTVTRLDYES